MIHGKFYRTLPKEAMFIREEVFMKEQGFENEFDDTDHIAVHYVLFDDDAPIGCCRYFPDKEPDCYLIGRIAILSAYREKHLGAYLLAEAEKQVKKDGGIKLALSAQLRVKDFYIKQGYTPMGDIYMDEHCEHIHMEKML